MGLAEAPESSAVGARLAADGSARRVAWALLLLALVALHVGMASLRPMHVDTLMTGGKMLMGWGELWADTRSNAFPPLYYLCLRLLTSLAGASPAVILLLSMLSVVASAPALAWAIRPWAPEWRLRWLGEVAPPLSLWCWRSSAPARPVSGRSGWCRYTSTGRASTRARSPRRWSSTRMRCC